MLMKDLNTLAISFSFHIIDVNARAVTRYSLISQTVVLHHGALVMLHIDLPPK